MRGILPNAARTSAHVPSHTSWFSQLAAKTSAWTGKPVAFLCAVALIVIWGVTGPIFGYSDTWQLVVNTGTTIVTFLMVFLIQNTQNRDTLALQVKLSELILSLQNADDKLAFIEDTAETDLEEIHDDLKSRAQNHPDN